MQSSQQLEQLSDFIRKIKSDKKISFLLTLKVPITKTRTWLL